MDTPKYIERMERKIDALFAEIKRQETWVTVSVVKELTGWDTPKLRRMRNAGVIKMRRKDKIEYLVESIPQQLLKQ